MSIVNYDIIGYAQQRGVNAEVMAVLTRDSCGLFAVYVGIIKGASLDWPDATRDQHYTRAKVWVSHMGTKQSWRNACRFFDIKENEYRT